MINLRPGPSQLFHSVRDHLRQALKLRVAELPQDSPDATDLIQQASRRLRELLSIPAGFTVYFLPSSSIIRERIAHDLVHFGSVHPIPGELSRCLYESSVHAGKDARLFQNHMPADAPGGRNAGLIALAHTESNGTQIPSDALARYKRNYPDALIALDASCALPYADLPYEHIDTVFLDFHFGFGLPAGLAAWIVNKKCFGRNESVRRQQGFCDSAFSLTALQRGGQGDRASKSINLLSVASLNGVLGDMLSRGVLTIRRETEYKAALLYQVLENHPMITPAVDDRSARARTIIGADCGAHYRRVVAELQRYAVTAGDAEGDFRDRHLLFANFPTHSREQYERLADILSAIR